MFLGEHTHSIDPKGRVVLPSRFRPDLAKGCFITKGQDRCLFVFTPEAWEQEVERIRSLPRTDRKLRNYSRVFFAGAIDQKPDKQGRIQLPATLRDYAGLDKEVTVVGVGERVEIWDSAKWQEVTAAGDVEYADIEEALSEHGI
ncbi:MAG: division/cell wall cluster transcriptional repressor MraZ [Acidimicrobiia bacterium]|nr:division/cell wall cluster transcriptional repressor MraZ [Acidimicrobiia bacterium]MBT8216557.1 division/cell wall cluster transcriptional repressor MraZ [Acidimicrobiia bacterium]NNF11229.1 division/cell wall cluster transcriptional repressor MraZ [Acidimicrobiia bacterium]NNL68965.1 division/cell wall cluster transcriptional repressor MraZ [Acidimicrobiia bacterium]